MTTVSLTPPTAGQIAVRVTLQPGNVALTSPAVTVGAAPAGGWIDALAWNDNLSWSDAA